MKLCLLRAKTQNTLFKSFKANDLMIYYKSLQPDAWVNSLQHSYLDDKDIKHYLYRNVKKSYSPAWQPTLLNSSCPSPCYFAYTHLLLSCLFIPKAVWGRDPAICICPAPGTMDPWLWARAITAYRLKAPKLPQPLSPGGIVSSSVHIIWLHFASNPWDSYLTTGIYTVTEPLTVKTISNLTTERHSETTQRHHSNRCFINPPRRWISSEADALKVVSLVAQKYRS